MEEEFSKQAFQLGREKKQVPCNLYGSYLDDFTPVLLFDFFNGRHHELSDFLNIDFHHLHNLSNIHRPLAAISPAVVVSHHRHAVWWNDKNKKNSLDFR